jgi:hypothetical protein
MTRGNINCVYQKLGHAPSTLFFYHNGDQYPTGMRDHFNVLDLVAEPITPARFKEWAQKNYEGVKVQSIRQPKVYYTDGFITDYSYVFECNRDDVLVWNWDKSIFSGTREEFIKWIKEQK